MATIPRSGKATLGDTIAAIVATDGTRGAVWSMHLASPIAPLRDLADLVHALCTLHGTLPGLVELAATNRGVPAARAWLEAAGVGFAEERRMLAALTAAVGPLPSTPGQAQSEAAVTAQRHALTMLAQSDRAGCAVGAAYGFLIDWAAIRPLLERTADRVGIAMTAPTTPDAAETLIALDRLSLSPGAERAVAFGAHQLVAQHRGLWHLLDARASARSHV